MTIADQVLIPGVDTIDRARGHHEIYGTCAALDRLPAVEEVHAFVSAMRKAGDVNDVHIYDDVNHGFQLYVERDLEHNRPAAAQAWERLKTYLARTPDAQRDVMP